MIRQLGQRIVRKLGYRVVAVGDDSWLVQRRNGGRRPLRVRNLDGRAWVVQRGASRTVRRMGPPGAKTHLVVNESGARAHMQDVQRRLSGYLAQEQVAWILRDKDVNCVLDVGANVGQFARSLRRNGYTGRIVSFEPVAGLVKELKRASEDDPDWHIFEFALGDAPGEFEIHIAHGDANQMGTMSSLLPSSEFGQEWSAKLRDMPTELIAVRRLDAIFEDVVQGIADPRVYLKMDTQGYDLKAFSGAGQCLDKVVGLQSEVSCVPIYDGMPHMLEQLAAYEAAGYSPAGIFQVSRHRASLRVIEFDVVMVKEQTSERAA